MQDLSSVFNFGVMGESSMAAGNTSSVNPPFSPPGSPNEAYALSPVSDHPELDLGPAQNLTHAVSPGTDEAHQGYGWTALDSDDGSATASGWTET